MLSARSHITKQIRLFSSLREKAIKVDPRYLRQPEIKDHRKYPEYPTINVCLLGYDFVPLESYQAYVHKVANRFNFNVIESYAIPGKNEKIVLYRPRSTIPDREFFLTTYQRVIRISNIPSVRLQLFSQLIRTHAPIGINIIIKEFSKEDENERYIPDIVLKEKQEELKSLDDPFVRKQLGWE
ncbi:39S ribosomal protein L48, mitochondrial [Strongyloides ratti]|uniref:39S ribosomal protein L48, mitochondrial n=1 Tax=Strongyloides ratti TaxID=34506 RepID=A0A090LNF4_STRRB|nr:39S ribosomal protein L48, mitochondrial [Strongyloides ratti]CEF69065.1 39S ribosomal protein L48, mitochondrial [Strongyloides ratti]